MEGMRLPPSHAPRASPLDDGAPTELIPGQSCADVDQFYSDCHPDKDNLCLYGAALRSIASAAPVSSSSCRRCLHLLALHFPVVW